MLAAAGISVDLHRTAVLRNVSLDVRPGEVLALIGPNGAGKSTLLHVLSGALSPDRGAVRLDGRLLKSWTRQALARRRAVLPQAPVLLFPFRVIDVVMLGRSPHLGRAARTTDLWIVDACLRETGTTGLAERLYPTLSGGERQRVQLAQALAQVWPEHGRQPGEGGYLLFDEPTNNLDLRHQQAIMRTARRLARAGVGVLAILHDPNLAALHADRICILREGRVLADGPPDTVMEPNLFETAFGLRVSVQRHPRCGRPLVLPA